MNNTLTTLRAVSGALRWNGKPHHWKAADELDTLIASMEAQEPVLYQYRWLNPNNNPDDVGLMDWKLLEPRNPYMGTVQDRIDELEAYRYEGKVVYEVRALYAQPSEPSMEAQEPVQVWCDTCEGGGTVDNTLGGDNINATSHDECPDCDGRGYWHRKVAQPSEPKAEPVQEQMNSCDTCKHCVQGKNPVVKVYEMVCFECSQYFPDKWEQK